MATEKLEIEARPDPKCSRCKGTGVYWYLAGPNDVEHDICDCVLEAARMIGGAACRS